MIPGIDTGGGGFSGSSSSGGTATGGYITQGNISFGSQRSKGVDIKTIVIAAVSLAVIYKLVK